MGIDFLCMVADGLEGADGMCKITMSLLDLYSLNTQEIWWVWSVCT